MVNDKDLYEQLGCITAKLNDLKDDSTNTRTEIKEHNYKLDKLSIQLTELQVHFKNHLSSHTLFFKIFIPVFSILLTALIGIFVRFLNL